VVDKVRVGLLGKTPGFFEPRLEFVFFSVFLTVSGLICSTYSKRTIWSANSSSVMPLTPIWSLATRQMNESGFSFAVQAPPFGTFSREASGKSHSQVLLNKSLLDANHGAAADGERLGNLLIGGAGFALADDSLMSRVRATR